MMAIRRVPTRRGWSWIKEGFALVRQAPLIWMVTGALFVVVLGVLSMIPLFGSIAATVLQPVLVAGLIRGCRDQASGGEFRLEHLFLGFQENTKPLLLIGLLLGLASLVLVMVVVAVIMATGLLGSVMVGAESWGIEFPAMSEEAALLVALLAVGLGLLLSLPLAMAAWFSPALVMLDRLAPMDALRASFSGCLRNSGSFMAYGALLFALLFIAMVPFGLGLLLWLPVLFASVYFSYRDIYRSSG